MSVSLRALIERASPSGRRLRGAHLVLVDAPLEVRRARVVERSRAAAQTGELPVSPEVFALTDQRYEMPSPDERSELGIVRIDNLA